MREHCGNIIEIVKDSGVSVMCCGQKMTDIIPCTHDGAVEKHIPKWTVKANTVYAYCNIHGLWKP